MTVAVELTDFDRALLDQIQREVPLTPRPFAAVAEQLAATEEQVLSRLGELTGPPPAPIRQISAIFDSKVLGYQSCLVAARIDPQRVTEAAETINRHPGVSHNYQREHAYNLWFTLAVPPDSRLGLEGTVRRLREMTGASQMRLMPAVKLFKIGVKFDLGVDSPDSAPAIGTPAVKTAAPAPLTVADKRIIRVLQQHLPVAPQPFDSWAEQAEVTVEQILEAAARYGRTGVMRRFSAVLRHRAIGVSANAMGVWVVPAERQEEFGRLAATYPAVSHCYQRPTYPDWPYSIFTMVHGRTREECEQTLAAISRASGVTEYASLYSTVEFKKVRVKYFVGDIEAWEATEAAPASCHADR